MERESLSPNRVDAKTTTDGTRYLVGGLGREGRLGAITSIALEVGHGGFVHQSRVISACHICGCQVAVK